LVLTTTTASLINGIVAECAMSAGAGAIGKFDLALRRLSAAAIFFAAVKDRFFAGYLLSPSGEFA